jgi:hypothetical protein
LKEKMRRSLLEVGYEIGVSGCQVTRVRDYSQLLGRKSEVTVSSAGEKTVTKWEDIYTG